MRNVRGIAPVWRSGGKGILSAVAVLLLSLGIGCKREQVPSSTQGNLSEASAGVSWRGLDLQRWSEELPGVGPSRVEAYFQEGESGGLELRRMVFYEESPSSRVQGPVGATVECYANSDCEGTPISVTECASEGCVERASRDCRKKAGRRGCLIIKWNLPFRRKAGGELAEWAAALTRLPLKQDEEAFFKLLRGEGGKWVVQELGLDTTFTYGVIPEPGCWMMYTKSPWVANREDFLTGEDYMLEGPNGKVEFLSLEEVGAVKVEGLKEVYLAYVPPSYR